MRQVAVIGSWGDWMVLHDLRCEEDEGKWRWEVSVNLPVGEHLFKFTIDGEFRSWQLLKIGETGQQWWLWAGQNLRAHLCSKPARLSVSQSGQKVF